MNKKLGLKEYILAVISTLLLVAFDQLTKLLAVSYLKDAEPIQLIPGVFQLQYLENSGAAFGIFQNQRIMFIILTVVILVVIGHFFVQIPRSKRFLPLSVCMIFIAAGAVGNFLDRLFKGIVVDFFYFSLIDFPIFNVADIYITVAFFVVVVLIFGYYTEEELRFISAGKSKPDEEIHEEK